MELKEFTKRQQIVKSIELALIPQGRTRQTIADEQMLEYDEAIRENTEKLRPAINAWCIDLLDKGISAGEYDDALFDRLYEADDKDFKVIGEEFSAALNKTLTKALPEGMSTLSKINSGDFIRTILPEYVKNTKNNTFDKGEAMLTLEALKNGHAVLAKFLINRLTALTVNVPKRELENFKRYSVNIPKLNRILESDAPEIKDFIDENPEVRDFASPKGFELCMSQAGIDGYNRLIKGVVGEKGIISKGLNMLSNEINAKNRQNKGFNGPYLPKLDDLYKLPLMPAEKAYMVTAIENDEGVTEILDEVMEPTNKARKSLLALLKNKKTSEGVIVSGAKLHTLSHLLYKDHNRMPSQIERKLTLEIEERYAGKKKLPKKAQADIDKLPDKVRSAEYKLEELESDFGVEKKQVADIILTQLRAFDLKISSAEDLIGAGFKKIKGDKKAEGALQDYYDALKAFKDTASVFAIRKAEDYDVLFYNDFNDAIATLTDAVRTENKVRAYITRKPGDLKKDRQTLLGSMLRPQTGWWHEGLPMYMTNHAIIKRDDRYYLYLMRQGAKKFDIPRLDDSDTEIFSQNKTAQGILKDVPRVVWGKKEGGGAWAFEHSNASEITFGADLGFAEDITVSREIYEIYRDKRYATIKGATEEQEKKRLEALYKYIDFVREVLDKHTAFSSFQG